LIAEGSGNVGVAILVMLFEIIWPCCWLGAKSRLRKMMMPRNAMVFNRLTIRSKDVNPYHWQNR